MGTSKRLFGLGSLGLIISILVALFPFLVDFDNEGGWSLVSEWAVKGFYVLSFTTLSLLFISIYSYVTLYKRGGNEPSSEVRFLYGRD